MHSWHFDDPASGSSWAFHANGDPLPSDVLVNRRNVEEYETFRTTSEELLTFYIADKLNALPAMLLLRSTVFVTERTKILSSLTDLSPDADWVLLRAVMKKEPDDAKELLVPLQCIKDFAQAVLVRKFENFFETLKEDKFTSAVGLIYFLVNPPPDAK